MINRIWSLTFTVKDLSRAVDFYENTLGLPKKYQFRDYAGFDCGGVEIGLKTWGGLEEPRQGEPLLDLKVADIEETYRLLLAKGVKFLQPPEDAVWGARFARFQDPDGNELELVEIDWRKYFIAANA